MAFGPVFSSHVRSIVWLAMVCPSIRLTLGVRRWMIGGKKPNMLEKWWGVGRGLGLNCLFVSVASSRAVRSPNTVTVRAASLSRGGIDITGVFRGIVFEMRMSPAMMLPQARRLRGLMIIGLFSLIGGSGLNRGWFIDTKKIIRRLYAAVRDVARRVRVRAQAFRCEVLSASMIASLEKNPAKKGVPVRARLPIVRQEEVKGVRWCIPPILRMSCSSFRLWMTEPEHRNSMALKNAWVQMWKNASCG